MTTLIPCTHYQHTRPQSPLTAHRRRPAGAAHERHHLNPLTSTGDRILAAHDHGAVLSPDTPPPWPASTLLFGGHTRVLAVGDHLTVSGGLVDEMGADLDLRGDGDTCDAEGGTRGGGHNEPPHPASRHCQ
jgi:hypothetical protein